MRDTSDPWLILDYIACLCHQPVKGRNSSSASCAGRKVDVDVQVDVHSTSCSAAFVHDCSEVHARPTGGDCKESSRSRPTVTQIQINEYFGIMSRDESLQVCEHGSTLESPGVCEDKMSFPPILTTRLGAGRKFPFQIETTAICESASRDERLQSVLEKLTAQTSRLLLE